DEDETGALRLATHAHGAPDRPLSVLRDPAGRRVIMVFSACPGGRLGDRGPEHRPRHVVAFGDEPGGGGQDLRGVAAG
ncbi:hypothetical protein, partial [Nocardia cyriacigeorgica]|uniref:hypothetical protein n=1 Tax=Nocardia cyriacigeorgica TaxID=135487 RepID=UPI001C49A74D